MNDISLVGWIAIIFLILIVLATNLSLFALLRSKKSNQSDSRIVSDTLKTLKNPWEKENKDLRELSDQVQKIKIDEDHQP
ncbi:MAG: hypothetical protein AB1453_09805 [Chloroflexota bacterium]|jgi:hypothetical protein